MLFADVMGSMDLAERSDPEQWRQIMERFFAILCDGVHRFEGTVDKFTGDGIMALFGAPIAHEDHAQRACYAALHLQRRAGRLRGRAAPRATGSASRSGWASTRARSSSARSARTCAMDYTAIGHTVGLAQRMEQLAEPGKAYLTEHTRQLVEGYLDARRPRRVPGQGRQPSPARPRAGGRRRAPARASTSPRARLLALRRPRRRAASARGALEQARGGSGAGDRDRRRGGRRQEPSLRRVRAALPGEGIPVYEARARRTPSRSRSCRCSR